MISEAGHFALILAFALAIIQGLLPLIGAEKNNHAWMGLAVPAAHGQLVMIAIAFASLTWAYVTSDFSVLNVANNSHSAKPMLYKVSGVWANHEGSMLLWVLILALYGSAIALFGGNLRHILKVRVLAIQGLVGVGFLAFILFTSNPFLRILQPPADGGGLNPLLQDPGLAFHPPLLYLGYVGFSTTFSFAMAALIEGRLDPAWARWVRPWTLAAWAFLTAGIGLGSWWAYYELGWGGWWFWDPVENASFMPWLAGTALLHSAIVLEKRDALKSWTVFLAIIAFALSLLGTFLVRSGVLTSVHAFASDPGRGLFILVLLLVTVGAAFGLFAWRGPSLGGGGLFRPVSREGGLLLNNFLLTTAAASILLGTLFPLLLDAMGGGKVSVGAPYFTDVFVPLMVPLVLAMGMGPLLAWKRGDGAGALRQLKFAVMAAFGAALAVWVWAARDQALPALGMALAAWLMVSTLVDLARRASLFRVPFGQSMRRFAHQPRASWGMTLAHGGLAVAIAGMTASSAWKVERIQVMHPGETVNVAGHQFTFKRAEQISGPNYRALQGHFEVARKGGAPIKLAPEKRTYQVRNQPTTEAAIHSTFTGDLYAVIGDPQGSEKGGGFITRLYFNPLVPWMWVGGLIMILGACISLSDRRHRLGAPARQGRVEA